MPTSFSLRRLLSLMITLLMLGTPLVASAWLTMTAKGMGGGGWLHSGCFDPTNRNTMIVGGDLTGSVYRTDDFGQSWRQWSLGLHNNDWEESQYVEDFESVITSTSEVKYYAATQGGVYRRGNTDQAPWVWSSSYAYNDTAQYPLAYFKGSPWLAHRQAIPFACLDWNGGNILYGGAGRVRFGNDSYETDFFPGCSFDTTHSGCIKQPYAVWKCNVNQYSAKWTPIVSSNGFGAVRDISAARISSQDYVAVVTRNGIFLYREGTAQWDTLQDNLLAHCPSNYPMGSLGYGPPTTGQLSGWSVHLTQRGDLYVAMAKHSGSWASGVYLMRDVINNPNGYWYYTTDYVSMPDYNEDMWALGQNGNPLYANCQPNLVYMTVEEKTDRDIIHLAARWSNYGLFKGVNMLNPSAYAAVSWANQIRGGDGDWDPTSFEQQVGWMKFWGASVLFHPMVFSTSQVGDPTYMAMQMNGKYHVSSDGGDSWINAYCGGSDGEWTNTGYSQIGVPHMAFLPDGRCLYGAYDVGLFRTTDGSQEYSERLMPPENVYQDTETSTALSHRNAYDIAVRPNWLGNNYDAVFVTFTPWSSASTARSKLMMYREVQGEDPEWVNLSQWAPDRSDNWFYDFELVSDNRLFVIYQRKSDGACGVYRVTYSPTDSVPDKWDWVNFTGDLDNDMGLSDDCLTDRPQDLLYNTYNGSRLFLASRRGTQGGAGGIWLLADFDNPSWQRVFYGAGTNLQMNFFVLAQASNGSRLYGGAGGLQGGHGGVVKCLNPAASTDPNNWVVLTEPTGFTWSTDPPIWQPDYPSLDYGKMSMQVEALAVYPSSPDYVYAGLTASGFSQSEGIWVHNGTSWSWASHYDDYNGPGVKDLAFNPYVPGQLLMGTLGIGLWRNDVVPGGKALQPEFTGKESKPRRVLTAVARMGASGLRFTLSRSVPVEICVYDLRGRVVRKTNLGETLSGENMWRWDGKDGSGQRTASGVYLAKLRAAGEEAITKFVIVH